MDRRTLIQASLAASLLPAAALAQSSANMPTPETRHAADTLEAGAVSLDTSKAALGKSADAALKRFAEFEVAEQETIAKVVKAASTMLEGNPPKLGTEAQSRIDKLKAMPAGKEFDHVRPTTSEIPMLLDCRWRNHSCSSGFSTAGLK